MVKCLLAFIFHLTAAMRKERKNSVERKWKCIFIEQLRESLKHLNARNEIRRLAKEESPFKILVGNESNTFHIPHDEKWELNLFAILMNQFEDYELVP